MPVQNLNERMRVEWSKWGSEPPDEGHLACLQSLAKKWWKTCTIVDPRGYSRHCNLEYLFVICRKSGQLVMQYGWNFWGAVPPTSESGGGGECPLVPPPMLRGMYIDSPVQLWRIQKGFWQYCVQQIVATECNINLHTCGFHTEPSCLNLKLV